jgi:hypothetical protein
MIIDESLLSKFEAHLGTSIPGFRVAYKTDSKLMALFGLLLCPFNARFMQEYVTTWGSAIYFPHRDFYVKDPVNTFMVLAHEFVHLSDSQTHGFWKFHLPYVFPQVLALVPLILYGILGSWLSLAILVGGYLLACFLLPKTRPLGYALLGSTILLSIFLGWMLAGLWMLLIPAALVFLFLPSSGRTKWELRAYAVNFALVRWMFNQDPMPSIYDEVRRQFTGPRYLFMCWHRFYIEDSLRAASRQAAAGTLQKEATYQKVYEFLEGNGLLAR